MAAGAGAGVAALRAAGSTRPNILFMLADDQRADTIAALGNPAIRTPNLDTLVRRGMVFRNAYCMGGNNAAVCTPSRNMILSGRAYTRYEMWASGDDPNFPDSMKAIGYETYHHGKKGNSAVKIQEKFEINKYLNEESIREAGDPGKQIADSATEFLKSRKTDRPFFMYLAFETPHDPRVPRKEDLASYDPAEIPLPKNFAPVHPFDNGEMVVRDELLAPWPRTPEEIRRQLREYYAVITGLDRQVGRVLEALKSRPEYANTIVIYSADQGLAVGSHGLMGKQSLYDHSMKAPLIFAGPGIPKGESNALVYLMDIYPTVLQLVGGSKPAILDGIGFGSAFQRKPAGRPSLYLAYRSCQRALRDDRYKLIVYPQINKIQLFDLVADPAEIQDLSGDPAQRERIQKMMAGIRDWQKRLGDSLPLQSEHPSPAEFIPPTGEKLQELRRRWRMAANGVSTETGAVV
jgi:arylsulfatase A-like enzyme